VSCNNVERRSTPPIIHSCILCWLWRCVLAWISQLWNSDVHTPVSSTLQSFWLRTGLLIL
jgi:hypothetical protein